MELVVNFMKLLLYLSPFVVGFIGRYLSTRLHAKLQRINEQCTEEQWKEYLEENDLKCLITVSYGKPVYTCRFSQVSEADAQVFDTWLTQTDASLLEFQTIGGPCVQIKREIICGLNKELELVPRGKISTTERFIAIRGEDGTLIHSFETGPYKASRVSRNFVGLLLVVLFFTISQLPIDVLPLAFGVIAFCISDYDNLPYLLKQWANEE